MQLYATQNGTSRALLARVLRKTENFDDLPAVHMGAGGKPYFPDHPTLHFSLSHSGKLVLCAIGRRPVGVDIEVIVPRRARLPAYALSAPEFRRYEELGGDWPAFYALWTKKEAWCKYTGRGLGKSFRETPAEDGLFYRSYAHVDWCATVCGETEPPSEIIWLETEED